MNLRRARFLPKGGPDGGDGGRGGDVVILGSVVVGDLSHFLGRRVIKGERGGDGGGQKKTGKDGETVYVNVPLGTLVWEKDGEERRLLGEIIVDRGEVTVAVGGQGGRGNVHFATSTNQTPMLAEAGQEGETRDLLLELRMIADVAIIGKPGAGKSRLLRQISSATPVVAEYPFTTTEPVLGIVKRGWQQLTFAELPGLVLGASQGKGLGNSFLRQALRTRLLLHLVDGSSPDPLAEVQEVNEELSQYDPSLLSKPQIVVLNKCDLEEVQERIPGMRSSLADYGVAQHFISAQTGKGVEEMLRDIERILAHAGEPEVKREAMPLPKVPVRRLPRPRPEVKKEGDVFVVISSPAERLVTLPDLRRFVVRLQLREQLAKLGVVKALEAAGVKPGDRVRIGKVEIRWE